MFRKHARDVIVDDNDIVHFAKPLLGEHSNRRGAATYAHALFLYAVDNRSLARLYHHLGTVLDLQFGRLAIAQVQQRVASRGALVTAASCEMPHAAQRQHLRSVFARGHMADRLSPGAHGSTLRPEMTVGVNLHLYAAVTEYP